MRITCPTCTTQYEVDENDISFTGQDVQCSECMTIWTQTRNGEATNPRIADALAEDAEEFATDTYVEETPDVDETPDLDESAPSDLNYPDEAEETEAASEDDTADQEAAELEVLSDSEEPSPIVEEVEDEPLEEATSDIRDDEPDQDVSETSEQEEPEESESELEETPNEDEEIDAVEEDIDEPAPSDSDEEENPIWKEIAAIAQEAHADSDDESSAISEYSPPDEIPPIQSTPAAPDDSDTSFDAPEEDDRPWDVAAEAEEEGFSDFVWNDPSKDEGEDAPAVEPGKAEALTEDAPDSVVSAFTPFTDEPAGQLEKMDDDVIAAALKEQMDIEDALEKAPKRAERDIEHIPVELGGPLRHTPNVEALKKSVRSKTVKLTKEEEKERAPARRFRRGLSLSLLIFVILLAIYVARAQITEYLPAAGPYLETYAGYVDILRANAEVLGASVWELGIQGYDWVMVKISG